MFGRRDSLLGDHTSIPFHINTVTPTYKFQNEIDKNESQWSTGNNWRFKYPDEIRANVSSSFRTFIQSEECRRSYSEESGITLYYNSMGKKYSQLQVRSLLFPFHYFIFHLFSWMIMYVNFHCQNWIHSTRKEMFVSISLIFCFPFCCLFLSFTFCRSSSLFSNLLSHS